MPIYLRTATRITPPPSSELSSDDEGQFVRDPSQVFDVLPQPYRMINKIVTGMFDDAWDIIAEREADRRRSEARYIPPRVDPSNIIANQGATVHHVRASSDGHLTFVALNGSVTVVECESGALSPLAEFQGGVQPDVVAIYGGHGLTVNARERTHTVYPICTLDATGTLRLLVYIHSTRSFLPCKTWIPVSEPSSVAQGQNVGQSGTDDDSTRKLYARGVAEFSGDLEYLATHVYDVRANSGESYVELYRLPKEVWVREAEAVLNAIHENDAPQTEVSQPEPQPTGRQHADPNDPANAVPSQFSEPTLLWKIKPVSVPNSLNMGNLLTPSVGKMGKGMDTPATGESHLITQLHFERRSAAFEHANAHLMTYLVVDDQLKPARMPTMMFLSAGRLLPIGSESQSEGGDTSASLAIWWSGGFQLFIYSLLRQGKDAVLEACVPFSSNISATACSPCTSLVAVLLENENLIIWDKTKGIKRKLLNLNDVSNRLTPRRVVTLDFLPSSRIWNEVCARVMKPRVSAGRTTISTELLRRRQPANCKKAWENNVQVLVAFSNGSVYLVNSQIDPDSVLDDQYSLARNDLLRVHDSNEPEYSGLAQCYYLNNLPGLICLVGNDGRLFVHDLLKPRTNAICELAVPSGYQLTASWKSVIAIGSFGARLVARVTTKEKDDEKHDDLLMFDLKSAVLLAPYAARIEKYDVAVDQESTKKRFNMQETLDSFVSRCINERMSGLPDRQAQFKSWWSDLQSAKQRAHSKAPQQKTRQTNVYHLDMRTYSVIMNG